MPDISTPQKMLETVCALSREVLTQECGRCRGTGLAKKCRATTPGIPVSRDPGSFYTTTIKCSTCGGGGQLVPGLGDVDFQCTVLRELAVSTGFFRDMDDTINMHTAIDASLLFVEEVRAWSLANLRAIHGDDGAAEIISEAKRRMVASVESVEANPPGDIKFAGGALSKDELRELGVLDEDPPEQE